LKIPEQVIEKELLSHIRFHEVAYLELKKVKGKEVILEISNSQLPPSQELDEIKDKIKKFSDLIDYWSVDWDYDGTTFRNQWQSYRTKSNPKVKSNYMQTTHTQKKAGIKLW